MIFRVYRTGISCPCDEAFAGESVYRGSRAGKTFKFKVWLIELNSLEDLTDFVSKYGQVVIDKSDSYLDHPYSIEIYDDYRE